MENQNAKNKSEIKNNLKLATHWKPDNVNSQLYSLRNTPNNISTYRTLRVKFFSPSFQ